MNLIGIREGELKTVFDILEDAFEMLGLDFYVIGALAKDIWYSQGEKRMRQTKDVDFAIQVGSVEDYQEVRKHLKENRGFSDSKENEFVLITPEGIQIDILPFGAIEIDGTVTLAGTGLNSISVTGFKEVLQQGTESVDLQTGHKFKTATLPAIVLLKLIAFDDRPEKRTKDPGDIAGIIEHYFDLQAEFIYENHPDLFLVEDDGSPLSEISARVIGREIKKIAESNKELTERLIGIITRELTLKEDSVFVRRMIGEIGKTAEYSLKLLSKMLQGLSE